MAKTLTAEEIEGMTLPKLRKAAEDIALEHKGLRKAELVEKLKEYHLDDEEDDELEDDELDDELDDEEDDLTDTSEENLPTPEDDDEDEEELDEPEKPAKKGKSTPPEPSGDTLTAKQVATRIGTDAKTLRKFFRSPASTVEPVGQGGRYEFAKEDLEKIKAEFEKWNSGKTKRGENLKRGKPAAPKRSETIIEEDDDEELELEDPDDDELDDDEELDLELDDEDDEDED